MRLWNKGGDSNGENCFAIYAQAERGTGDLYKCSGVGVMGFINVPVSAGSICKERSKGMGMPQLQTYRSWNKSTGYLPCMFTSTG